MKFSCIIVNEDARVRKVFEDYITMLNDIELFGSFSDTETAKQFMKNNAPDVVLANVNMLKAGGFDHIESIQPPPEVVMITNNPCDAYLAFENDAADCLVWPVSFDRFLKTTDKIRRRLDTKPEPKYFFVKSDYNFVKIEFDKILYIEGLENYVRICCENKAVLTLSTMKSVEATLASHNFLRIHRSYIVNLDKVDDVLNYNFYIGKKGLPIGRSYRKSITDKLKTSFVSGQTETAR